MSAYSIWRARIGWWLQWQDVRLGATYTGFASGSGMLQASHGYIKRAWRPTRRLAIARLKRASHKRWDS